MNIVILVVLSSLCKERVTGSLEGDALRIAQGFCL